MCITKPSMCLEATPVATTSLCLFPPQHNYLSDTNTHNNDHGNNDNDNNNGNNNSHNNNSGSKNDNCTDYDDDDRIDEVQQIWLCLNPPHFEQFWERHVNDSLRDRHNTIESVKKWIIELE